MVELIDCHAPSHGAYWTSLKYSLLPVGSGFMDFAPGFQPAGQTAIQKHIIN
jgi:hypothetical protein